MDSKSEQSEFNDYLMGGVLWKVIDLLMILPSIVMVYRA
jgi:hypothetical protein